MERVMMLDKRLWCLLALVLLIGCQRQRGGGSEELQVPVAVNLVERGNVRRVLTCSGDIKAELEVKVFSKIPDRIEQCLVDAGDRVRRGDPLVRIMATTIEQAVRQAEASLAAARAQSATTSAEFERAERLHKEDAISTQQFEVVRAQYESSSAQLEQARAGLATAQSQLRDATIVSPIDGVIGIRYFDAGDMASPGAPLASVVQMERVKIEFGATEEDLGSLSVGQTAQVRVRSYPDLVFEGKITKISPVLDPATRMATVEVLVPNRNHKLKPGMYAEVEITLGLIEDTVVVPRGCVLESTSLDQSEGGRRVVKNYLVFVINDGNRAEQRELDVAYINQTHVAVRSGLEVGERLVVAGQKNLRDGMAVLIPAEVALAPATDPADPGPQQDQKAR